MTSLLLALLLATPPQASADLSGKWSGTFEPANPDGNRTEPVFLILKQEGKTLTGSGGPNEGEQHPIANGTVDGEKVTFEVPLEKGTIYFSLTATGAEIKGDMRMAREDREQNAKVSLKRVVEK